MKGVGWATAWTFCQPCRAQYCRSDASCESVVCLSVETRVLHGRSRAPTLLRVPSIKVTDPAAKVFSELPSAVTPSGGQGAASLVADAHINLNLCLGSDANNMRGEP
jgi:hypothetical protein